MRSFRMSAAKVSCALAAIRSLELSCAWTVPPAVRRCSRHSVSGLSAYLEDGPTGSGSVNRKAVKGETGMEEETLEDYKGAGTLGDIMSSQQTSNVFSGLVTTDGGLLQHQFGVHFPMDRMALTANGNLQRLFSSYYDSPVHVVVDACQQTSPQTWDRVVHLMVHDTTFCTATSLITVNDQACRELVESRRVGLGQLFRHLDKLPNFSLQQAGYSGEGGLWRVYELTCSELTCHIREEFLPGMWNIQPR